MALSGVGTDHVATLLVAVGDNPKRLKSKASFASLCGTSPIEASSGKVVSHRLNRGGNRDARAARCIRSLYFEWARIGALGHTWLAAPSRAKASGR